MIADRYIAAATFLLLLPIDAGAQERPTLSFGNIVPSEPPVQKTLFEYCSEAAEYAADIMAARQQGAPIYDMMERVGADYESGAYTFLSEATKDFFLMKPYEYEIAPTDRLALKTVAEYRDMIFSGCMREGEQ